MGGTQRFAGMLFLVLWGTPLWAVTPVEYAHAAIAIAQARIDLGKQQADLPDAPPRADTPLLNKVDPPDSQGFVSGTVGRKDAVGEQGLAHTRRTDAPSIESVDETVVHKVSTKETSPLEASCLVRVGEPDAVPYLGSGTVIASDDKGSDVLTCWHIGRGVQSPQASIEIGSTSYPAKSLKLSPRLDLALYHVDEPLPHVDVASELPGWNWHVMSIGLNSVKQLSLLDIDKANVPTCLVTDGIELEGRSGGGLFFGKRLIGVIKERADSLKRSRYVALEEIQAFLKDEAPAPELSPAIPIPESVAPKAVEKPVITVMVCDGEECTEHEGKFDEFFQGYSWILVDATRFKNKNASVTAVTKGASSFPGELKSINGNVATVLVQGDIRLSPDIVEFPKSASGFKPMRMVPLAQGGPPVNESLPAQLVIEGDPSWCMPCRQLEERVRTRLTPAKWQIGESEHDQIRFLHASKDVSTIPAVFLYQNGSVLKQYKAPYDVDGLSRELLKTWNDAPKPQSPVAATGTAGTIHASDQIRNGFSYFRQYIGEGNTGSMIWDRQQATLNLFHMKDWEVKDLFGLNGRIQLDSPNAVNLPFKSLAFSYRLIGRDIQLDMEPMILTGLVDKLNPNQSKVAGAVHPVGLFLLDDSLMIYSIFCMVRDVFLILHPSADVILPDQIAASCVLNGDTMTVTFDKSPQVRLTWIFTLALTIKKVTITESNVHVDFIGSRFVRSRDFPVQ